MAVNMQVPVIPNKSKTSNVSFSSQIPVKVNENNKGTVSFVPYCALTNYVKPFFVQNPLSANLSGVDRSKLDPVEKKEGLNLDEVFAKNKDKVITSLKRLYNDKNVDGQLLKWIDLPSEELKKADKIQNFVENNVRNKFTDVVALGIGGSSLGGKALVSSLVDSQWNQMSAEARKGYPRMHFIENVDPDRYSEVVDKLDLSKTLVLVVSKSGKTPEPSSTYLNMQERLKDAVKQGIIPESELSKHIVAITDKDKSKSILKQEAIKNGYEQFEVPDDVGGRYSVVSDVGIVPAAMVGIDIKSLLKGAADMSKLCSDTRNIKTNPAAGPALVQKACYDNGKEYSVVMPYSDKLALFSDWYAQLCAESLGKEKDKDGNIYSLDATGKLMLIGKSGKGTGPVKKKKNILNTKYAKAEFSPSADQKYGYDVYQYAHLADYYPTFFQCEFS